MREKLLIFVAMNLLVFQVLISLPITIWLHNQFNFQVALIDAAGILGFLLLASSAVFLLLAFIIPERVRSFVLPAIVLATVLVYLQQNILVWDYGVLDGSQIDFSANSMLGLLDLILWASGIALYVFFRKRLLMHAGTVLIFIAVLTLMTMIVPLLSHDYSNDKSSASLSEASKFTYSAKQNIFLFVLDAFQSDLFQDIIDHDVELTQEFEGFTFYPNTTAVFAKTYPTIPLLLTGRRYQKKQPFKQFISAAYEESMLTDLVDQGWDVGLYPHVRSTIALNDSIMSNYADRTQLAERIDSYLQALDISLFRTTPHFLKSQVYNNGDFRLKPYFDGSVGNMEGPLKTREAVELPRPHTHRELNFLANLKSMATGDGEKPVFRFYHFYMPHRPFLLNRDLEYGRMSDTFISYREYAYAALKVMAQFMAKLKDLKIFDDSVIIILADHGGGEYGNRKYVSSEGRYLTVSEQGMEMASGKPLLLIKEFHDDGPLRSSSKPVSLLDVAPTIAKFAGLESKSFEGKPVGELLEGGTRERNYFHYHFSGTDSKYLADFEVFKIDGDVNDDAAWTKTGDLKVEFEVAEEKDYVLESIVRYGTDIKRDADYMNAFLVGGEYKYLSSYLVSGSGRIDLSLTLSSPLESGEIYMLALELAGNARAIDVMLEVDDNIRSSFVLRNKKSKKFVLFMPSQIVSKDRLEIHLSTPDSSDYGDGLLLSKLSLKKVTLSEFGRDSVIDFSKNHDRYYLQGVWPAEWWGRWTSEKKTTFSFVAGDGFCQNADLLLDIKKFYSSINPDSFQLSLNGSRLKTIKIEKTAGQGIKYRFDCSAFAGNSGRVFKVIFLIDKVASPLSLGKSGDPRTLGFGLVSMKFIKHAGDKKMVGNIDER